MLLLVYIYVADLISIRCPCIWDFIAQSMAGTVKGPKKGTESTGSRLSR